MGHKVTDLDPRALRTRAGTLCPPPLHTRNSEADTSRVKTKKSFLHSENHLNFGKEIN